ncbi:NAD-dependent epimerase/dehydratase family protein [Nocardioides sp. KC13]|uniref:NAD-dependent epimerase/dehydratase family protein n=1 Tax=Nocardioides turkmenicus TaxID=2711220 RepID=A0A6M1QXS1_9ACTN|nr:NAD-dependent epimerase/dehydratase family protein [Nocardioides sp. KC13]NGN94773.1 NAD-dependent epimerase/dehydratase family protein [Nocardioides sp. KC13]
MKVVVIGASGNLGTATIRALTADGAAMVVGVARRGPRGPHTSPHASVEWREADVSTANLEPVLEGADAVVHLAWKFQPTHRPEETWATNAVGTRRVLDAVARAGVPALVCVSSVAAYSPVDHDDPVDETWETDGASSAAYCREKAYVERALDAFAGDHPEVRLVRVRPAFVFQRSAASEQRRIFGGPLLRPSFVDRRRIPMVPVPAGLRFQAVHAGDVGRALAAAATTDVTGAFNLAAPGVIGRDELGELLEARTVEIPPNLVRHGLDTAWHARLAPVPGSLLDAVMQLPLMSTARAELELDWRPRHTAMEALEAVISGIPEKAGSDLPPLRP